MISGMPFQFEVQADFFEKGDAPTGKQRRIGGIISTESEDRQGETVIASGLDFSDWQKNGWYNDNHTKDTDGVVGYPEYVKSFKRGDKLPNGKVAEKTGHWAEGYLLKTDRANKLWELGQALQGTGRHLGFSVEGKIQRREGPKTIAKKSEDGKIEYVGNRIAKALVRNVAITNCPVNTDTGLEILARSLTAAEAADPTDWEARLTTLEKAMAMGTASPTVAPAMRGPQTGVGAGAIVAKKDLESDENPPKPIHSSAGMKNVKPPVIPKPPRPPANKGVPGQPAISGQRRKKSFKGKNTMPAEVTQKSLTDADAIKIVRWAIPAVDAAMAGRIVRMTKALKRSGRL